MRFEMGMVFYCAHFYLLVMSNVHEQLRVLIEQLLEQEAAAETEPKKSKPKAKKAPSGPPPEATKKDVFGTHLFGDRRGIKKDPDTPQEDDFYVALKRHVVDNTSDRILKIAPQLLALKDAGKYAEFLQPPNEPLYRFVSNISPNLAAERLGMNVDELKSQPHVPVSAKGNLAPYQPRKGIASWSTEPSGLDGFVNASPGQVVILFKTSPQSGNFVLNPYKLHDIVDPAIASYLSQENEVISVGDVSVEAAAFYYSTSWKLNHGSANLLKALVELV